MTIKKLIKNLQYYPRDLEVKIADWTNRLSSPKELEVADINRGTDEEDILVLG